MPMQNILLTHVLLSKSCGLLRNLPILVYITALGNKIGGEAN